MSQICLLTIFAKIKFSRKFPNFTIISQAQTIQYFNGMYTKRRMNVLKSLLFRGYVACFSRKPSALYLSSTAVMGGSRGWQGVRTTTPPPPPPQSENHGVMYVFLEILVLIPSRTNWVWLSNCISREVRTTLCNIPWWWLKTVFRTPTPRRNFLDPRMGFVNNFVNNQRFYFNPLLVHYKK